MEDKNSKEDNPGKSLNVEDPLKYVLEQIDLLLENAGKYKVYLQTK